MWWDVEHKHLPALSDKLVDWQAFAMIGGTDFVRNRCVLDIGPEYGVDAMMLAEYAHRYVMIDINDDVLSRLHDLRHIGAISRDAEIRAVDAAEMPFPGDTFDLVLDFGSIDNTLKASLCYAEAMRVLTRHGILITTYANRAVLQDEFDASHWEERQLPDTLSKHLTDLGGWVRWRDREDYPRAVMIAQKGGEPRSHCAWYNTHVCTCEESK